ncbi:tetratricopeptide repeat protein, partial [Rhodoplanes roseus]
PVGATTAGVGPAEAWPETLPGPLATKPLLAGIAQKSPAAAFEIAMRYAEGRGVPADLAAAAPWFQRAADLGLAPAQFRLGSLYEKGQGVKKDLAEARRWYQAAADRGNANAMHNIAVLYAEGIDGRPDFAMAAQWFTRAARHGVADSQYNLAILYARGIGIEQNLAEAYKWFAVAAQRGDKDAAKKRDDLAQRMDQQTLTAARLAAQSFVPLTPPEDAVTVPPPPGGWEDATAGQGRPKPKGRIPMEQAARL